MNEDNDITMPTKSVDSEATLQERLTDNVYHGVLPQRYLLDDESPEDMFARVAENVASAEAEWAENEGAATNMWADVFQHLMETQQFMPNSPTLMNAGAELQQLSACIAGNAPVYTRDGLKRMDEVQVGDEVLTHTGSFKEVTDHWSNGVKDTIDVKRGTCRGGNYDVTATGDHEFYNSDGEWVELQDLEKPMQPTASPDTEFPETFDLTKYTSVMRKDKPVVSDGGVVKVENNDDPRTGEYDQQYSDIVASVENTNAFAYLAGAYLAEGDVDGSDVRFTIGADETEFKSDIVDALQETFDTHVAVMKSSHGEWQTISCSSPFVADFFRTQFGTGSSEKDIPEWVFAAPDEYQQRLLNGLLDGDGHYTGSGYRLTLANPELCYEASLIARNVGYEANFKLDASRELSSNDTSMVWISDGVRTYTDSVSKRSGEPVEVYDMEVADDHSFVVGDFIVHNCFVLEPGDSMAEPDEFGRESILDSVKHAGQIFKSGGGVGYSFSHLRPKGAFIESTESKTSGPMQFMELFDATCETVKQGGKRRGAQMGIMRIDHADIGRFITAKRTEGDLDNFNISVALTDDFIEAVKNDETYTFYDPQTDFEDEQSVLDETLKFYSPEYEDNPVDWQDPRDGELVDGNIWRDHADSMQAWDWEDEESVSFTEKWYDYMDEYFNSLEAGDTLELPARFVWDMIVDGAWQNGEPGLFHYDETNEKHSFDSEEYPSHAIEATNPCAEQPLSAFEACNLGHINLSLMMDEDSVTFPEWRRSTDHEYSNLTAELNDYVMENVDTEQLQYVARAGTRFLDNVVTKSDFPLDEITERVEGQRKIGLGIMGWAQMLVQMGIPYGSEESYAAARTVMAFIDKQAVQMSHELAEERGCFEYWDESKYANPTEYEEWFDAHTHKRAERWEDGFPIRNHNVTTIAPTGCVDESSLISTDDGLTNIGDLAEESPDYEQWTDIDESVVTEDGVKEATSFYDAGFTDVKTITNHHGFTISATPNHQLRTVSDDGDIVWKEASSFEEGDTIVQLRDTFKASSNESLDTSERDNYHHNTDTSLELPETMTTDLAEFLGYWMGDGYTHTDVGVKVVVDASNEECIEYVTELGESVFGVEPTVEDKDSRLILSFGGRHLPRYFDDNGWTKDDGNAGEGSASAFVPEEVMQSSESVARAFCRGLFEADGCVSRKVELSTVSETLASQMQTLLLSLGHLFVQSEMDATDLGDGHYGDRTRYTVRGANEYEDKKFLERIGTFTKDTDIELTKHSYSNDVIPNSILDRPSTGSKSEKFGDYVHTMESVRFDSVAADGGRPISDYVFSTVTSVEDDVAYTKDISVPDNTQYVANGFISHNTTSMIGDTSGGCEPIYNVANFKNVGDDIQGDDMLVQFDDYFLRVLEANDLPVDEIKTQAEELMRSNEFDGVDSLDIPEEIAQAFVTTNELRTEQHVRMQRAFQEYVDSGISKTINAPNDATREDVHDAFMLALSRDAIGNPAKGITLYRTGSREEQVLTTRVDNKLDVDSDEVVEKLKGLHESGEVSDDIMEEVGIQ